jgi:hypothetical protein
MLSNREEGENRSNLLPGMRIWYEWERIYCAYSDMVVGLANRGSNGDMREFL